MSIPAGFCRDAFLYADIDAAVVVALTVKVRSCAAETVVVDWILAGRAGESHDQVTGKPIKILTGIIEQHINPDIAFAVKRYAEATGDDDFLFDMGAEIGCETARLYLDLGFYNENKGGLFCINEVTGPDEYNALVNNNAYTNLMAAEKIGLKDHEAQEWRRAAENIFVPRDGAP